MTRTSFPVRRLAAAAIAIPLLAACPVREVSEVPIDQSHEERVTFPIVANGKIDLLFVIDDSNSMEGEQDSLIADFATMLEPLQNLPGGLPSMHIGVISTDVGAPGVCSNGTNDDGELQTGSAGCPRPDGAFIVDEDDGAGGRTRNYSGDLGANFACLADLGVDGCGFEGQLESIRRALDPDDGVNPGFLREEALLAIVILSDEDDCSVYNDAMFGDASEELGALHSFRCFEFGVICDEDADPRALGPRTNCRPRNDSEYLTSVDEYIGFVKSLKPVENQIIVAGILGANDPVVVELDEDDLVSVADSCPAPTGNPEDDGADPPIRLAAFLDAFSPSIQTSICDADLSDAMQQIGVLIGQGVKFQCILGVPADTDLDTDGIQPDCTVSEVEHPGTDAQVERILHACSDPDDPLSSAEIPCYLIEENVVDCGLYPSHLKVEVFYDNADSRPLGTIVDAHCLID